MVFCRKPQFVLRTSRLVTCRINLLFVWDLYESPLVRAAYLKILTRSGFQNTSMLITSQLMSKHSQFAQIHNMTQLVLALGRRLHSLLRDKLRRRSSRNALLVSKLVSKHEPFRSRKQKKMQLKLLKKSDMQKKPFFKREITIWQIRELFCILKKISHF